MIHFYIMVKLVVDTAEIYDTNEAARLLKVGYATLYRWIKEGKLIPIRLSGRTFIPKSEIDRLGGKQTTMAVRKR